MLNFLRHLFRRPLTVLCPKDLATHLYIQLTPIPFDLLERKEEEEAYSDDEGKERKSVNHVRRIRSPEEMGDDREAAGEFMKGEGSAFTEWLGLPPDGGGSVSASPAYPGFDTAFSIYHTIPLQFKDLPAGDVSDIFDEKFPAASTFLADVFWACVMGDKGCTLEGQSFSERCRWKVLLK